MSTWWTRERKSREVKLINRWENFAIFLVELFFHLHPPSNTGNCILTAFSIYKIKEKVNSKKPFIESPQKPHSRWLYLAACFRNINTPCLYPRNPPPVCQLNHFSHNYLQELGGGFTSLAACPQQEGWVAPHPYEPQYSVYRDCALVKLPFDFG